MKIENHIENVKIGKFQKEIVYKKITELPTMKRSYPNVEFYVRGLNYEEVVEISKIGKYSLREAIRIYSDAIKINGNIELEDLELIDFLLLAVMSNLMTDDSFFWVPTFNCDNIIPLKRIKELEEEIEYYKKIKIAIEEKLKNVDMIINEEEIKKIEKDYEEIKNILSKLEKEYNSLDKNETEICNTKISKKLSIFDLDILIEDIEIPQIIEIDGMFLELRPLLVKDYIFLDENIEKLAEKYDTSEDLIILTRYIKKINNEDADFETVLGLLKYSSPKDVLNLKEICKKMDCEIKPIEVQCPYCKQKYFLNVKLENLKALPVL